MKHWLLFGGLSAVDLVYLLNLKAGNPVVNALIAIALAALAVAALSEKKIRKN